MRTYLKCLLIGVYLLLFSMSSDLLAAEVFARINGSATSFVAPHVQDEQETTSPTSANLELVLTSGDAMTPDVYTRQFSGAAANLGSVAVVSQSRASGTYNLTSGQAPNANGVASAGFTIDDLVFSGPGTLLDVSLNLDVSGFFSRFINPGSPGVVITAATLLDVDVSFGRAQTQSEFTGRQSNSVRQDGFALPDDTFFENGDLAGVTFPTTITLDPLTVVVGQVYSLSVDLAVSSVGRLGGIPTNTHSGEIRASSNFGSTANLPTSGPVFSMPNGFSVNSIGASIDDNVWLGSPVSVSAVPLPAAVWMFAAGVCVLARKATRRRLFFSMA